MTYSERVTQHNIELMRSYVVNGPEANPGANFVLKKDGTKLYIYSPPVSHGCSYVRLAKREDLAAQLEVGDVVERHLRNGDLVLFNRQPSLHKISIMCHKVQNFALPKLTLLRQE